MNQTDLQLSILFLSDICVRPRVLDSWCIEDFSNNVDIPIIFKRSKGDMLYLHNPKNCAKKS